MELNEACTYGVRNTEYSMEVQYGVAAKTTHCRPVPYARSERAQRGRTTQRPLLTNLQDAAGRHILGLECIYQRG